MSSLSVCLSETIFRSLSPRSAPPSADSSKDVKDLLADKALAQLVSLCARVCVFCPSDFFFLDIFLKQNQNRYVT